MEELLSRIESPADIKRLTIPQLTQLAEEIRERLIVGVAKTGGHLGPNLGVVELTLALHYVFDTPQDSFVFDVSHQAYVHKMLTGRNRRFESIRQPGGLNGFMVRTESEHDSYGAGHAGTAPRYVPCRRTCPAPRPCPAPRSAPCPHDRRRSCRVRSRCAA